jgi:hypothetical protein
LSAKHARSITFCTSALHGAVVPAAVVTLQPLTASTSAHEFTTIFKHYKQLKRGKTITSCIQRDGWLKQQKMEFRNMFGSAFNHQIVGSIILIRGKPIKATEKHELGKWTWM